ncbi:hypothetical protein ACFQHV_10725 [Promicromonospora thailandica]|uniref:Uncharacterized protein n=1 Tax=Promicromonospora thailandica TaxID=765201 RepID=A0A9X2G383_9MICO|nr:hypothetical protein [Promicromonospora thailandica]MCP2264950.1 hypothetical protein [Promicromonospora thailandica]BFF18770.1 hypothetical protein GCM10025730_22910 [Promicromonospora thailandica]
MPSPVSPDAGVPEHQPDQRRQQGRPRTGGLHRQEPNGPPPGRPQSGQYPSAQFPSGQFPSGQFPAGSRQSGQFPSVQPPGQPQSGPFATGQPQSGPFPAPPGGAPPSDPRPSPGRGDGRGRRATPRDWVWSVVAFVVAAVVIGAVGFQFFGPDGAEEAPGAVWAVDSCAGPDPTAQDTGAATDTYRPLTCDDQEATVTVLDIQDAVSVAQVHCPAGTDVVFQKDGQAGGDTQAVCARNLSDEHPGDPGRGGGQLVVHDCVDGDGAEVACSADGARKVTGLMVGGVQCPEGTADKLELGFDAFRSYETICLAG